MIVKKVVDKSEKSEKNHEKKYTNDYIVVIILTLLSILISIYHFYIVHRARKYVVERLSGTFGINV